MLRLPPKFTLFPYTTLFRSTLARGRDVNGIFAHHRVAQGEAGRKRRSEEHTSELQSRQYLVCRLLPEKKKEHERHIQSVGPEVEPSNRAGLRQLASRTRVHD